MYIINKKKQRKTQHTLSAYTLHEKSSYGVRKCFKQLQLR